MGPTASRDEVVSCGRFVTLFALFENFSDNGINPRFAGTICDPSGNVTSDPS